MIQRKLKKATPLRDGVVDIYRVENVATPGKMPKSGIVFMERLRLYKRTVGLTRYWEAKQAQVEVERVLRVPQREQISTQSVAVFEGAQYRIVQIQHIEDAAPPVMDLTLERLETNYDRIAED